jgi:hypothetical protein
MAEDPFDQVAAAVADVGERLGQYAEIWQSAVDRNNRGEYKADDYLVDLQALWGMSVRDVARIGSALIEVVGPLLPRDIPDSSGSGPDGAEATAAG